MTTVIESTMKNKYYVSLSVETRYNRELYNIQACPCYDDNRCGYPEQEMTYPIEEKKKAYATYRRYVKKYCA